MDDNQKGHQVEIYFVLKQKFELILLFCQKIYYWWWVMELWLRLWNKALVKLMKEIIVTQSKKMLLCRTSKQFWFVFDAKRVCSSRSIKPFIWMFLEHWATVIIKNSLYVAGVWFFHIDNAFAQATISIRQFLSKNCMILPHPPYMPNLAPCNFFLFPGMKDTSLTTLKKSRKKKNKQEKLSPFPKMTIKKFWTV